MRSRDSECATSTTRSGLRIGSHSLALVATLYFGFALNLGFWRFMLDRIEMTGLQSAVFLFSLAFFILVPLYLALNAITVPFLAKPVIIVFLLLSSAANYFMFDLGVFIDTDMMTNVFETTPREASELMTFRGFSWVFISGILPFVFLVFTKIDYGDFRHELKTRVFRVSAGLLILVSSVAFSYKEYSSYGRNNREVRKLINTVNYTYSTIRYFQLQALANREFSRVDPDAKIVPFDDPQKTVLILILGETARAGNFSLTGEGRNTYPKLAQQDVISFANVTSCGTSTAVSVPCMFSHIDRKYFDVTNARYTENFLDIAQNAGYDILWLDNDDGCKGVCSRVPNQDMIRSGNSGKFCAGDSCFDEVLIDGLEERLAGTAKDTLIILHTMGSHGPTYYKRYPEEFKAFTPTCDTAQIQNCSRDEIVNTYDNTILYTDHVVSKTIDILKRFPDFESGLLYVSDHGESLGENNIYLHGIPWTIAPEEQTRVPMILWMSENMKKYDHVDYGCMKEKAKTGGYSHDNLFHSLAGLLEIRTTAYDKDRDIFKDCRTRALPFG
jgi:lipid A ethanolaminephosphotransferase